MEPQPLTYADIPEKLSNAVREATKVVVKAVFLMHSVLGEGVGISDLGVLAEIYASTHGVKGLMSDVIGILFFN